MEEGQSKVIDIHLLRKGMFIQLDLGWMDHPFSLSSFKIATDDQIQTIVALGLKTIRFFPERSDPDPDTHPAPDSVPPVIDEAAGGRSRGGHHEEHRQAYQFAAQRRRLAACERQFTDAARRYRRVAETVLQSPQLARDDVAGLVGGCVDELLANEESVIRLLSESIGERSSQHPVNVMVVSLLLGQALDMDRDSLMQLGIAALLHDVGKLELPDRFRSADENFTATEYRLYQEHVARSLAVASRMGLSSEAVAGIAQHHEMVDGSGFPARLTGDQMQLCGKILALVNRYDNFCNPARAVVALTPHEALSVIFAQMKARFDPVVLSAFIRMMGVYPPGSVVQLGNDRYALVVSVNSTRPLRPKVIVHDPAVPRGEAMVADLETMPELGIRRSLKPSQLPKAALDYLSPRTRICYFFERAVDAAAPGDAA
ncbi:MAG: HD domain-containing phosphohydrolase [Pseudomonadota bacterium]